MDIDATIGGNNSNSMVSVALANAYIAEGPYPVAAWQALSEAEKTFRLVYAAKRMKTRYSWIGIPLHVNQAMPFPRYIPPRRYKRGAWPFSAETDGGFVYGGVFYPVLGWEMVLQFDELTGEQLAAIDIIPEDIKRAQTYLAYGVYHRGFAGVTDPEVGPKSKAQIKDLALFDSLKVSFATTPIQQKDSTALDLAIKSEHFVITDLLEGWTSHFSWGYGTELVPPLPEVVSTGGGTTEPSL